MLINNTLINCKKHRITLILKKIYVKNLFSLYRLQCKGDILVVDIKQQKSQFNNLNFAITQSAKFF